MDVTKENYIIVEIIPTASTRKNGEIAQLSALKLNGLQLVNRFDYRLNPKKITIPDIVLMTSYDKDSFTYLETTDAIMEEFKNFCEDYPLLILDNAYTKDYLSTIPNKKISFCDILSLEYHDDILNTLMKKYNLEPSNYIVDLLYESILQSDLNSD